VPTHQCRKRELQRLTHIFLVFFEVFFFKDFFAFILEEFFGQFYLDVQVGFFFLLLAWGVQASLRAPRLFPTAH
jgi:hypothetical protein